MVTIDNRKKVVNPKCMLEPVGRYKIQRKNFVSIFIWHRSTQWKRNTTTTSIAVNNGIKFFFSFLLSFPNFVYLSVFLFWLYICQSNVGRLLYCFDNFNIKCCTLLNRSISYSKLFFDNFFRVGWNEIK